MATGVIERVGVPDDDADSYVNWGLEEVERAANRVPAPQVGDRVVIDLGRRALFGAESARTTIRHDRVGVYTGRLTMRREVPLIIGPDDPEPIIEALSLPDGRLTDARAAMAAAYDATAS